IRNGGIRRFVSPFFRSYFLVEQGKLFVAQVADLPERLAARQAHRVERVGAGEAFEAGDGDVAGEPEVADLLERAVLRDGSGDQVGVVFAQAGDQAHAQADGGAVEAPSRDRGRYHFSGAVCFFVRLFLEGAVPSADVHVDGPHLHAVLLGVADELGGGVE